MRFNKEFDNYINFEDLELQLSGLHIYTGVKEKELKEHQKSEKKLKHKSKKY
ncbi:hypothetical protein HMPREF0454_03977 [Hafnia alvei ATCC 51873]|uniref:Uncharacterized protein n=1 Tax=Hafnia alvei ATCC 51873 TaxID=1002364 RepID=G9YBJ6_HAFAL|nr:hypothetical protein HMPREF0454_03977 [Hafnia alvei ATCC 51873]